MELFSLTTNTTITDIRWQAYPIGFFVLVLCLLTILGNILIIYAVIREDTLHTSTYYYIVSLASADLLVGLIAMPFAFIFEMTDDEYWLFSQHLRFLCDFWHSLDIFTSTASIFGLCTIGLDRYMTITKPIEYSNSFMSKRWYYMLSMIWISSAIISFPPVVYFGTEKAISRRSFMVNETISTSSLVFKECEFPDNPYYILFISVVSFCLPLIVMIYVYIQVYMAARAQALALRSGYKRYYQIKSGKSFIPECSRRQSSIEKSTEVEKVTGVNESNVHEKSVMLSDNRRSSPDFITLRIHHGVYQSPSIESIKNTNESDNKTVNTIRGKRTQVNTWRRFTRDQKAAKFVGIIMGIFIICWLPYFVYLILSGVFVVRLKDDENHELLFRIFSWLGYTNSALDVLVYVTTSKELQTTFFKLFIPRCFRSGRVTK